MSGLFRRLSSRRSEGPEGNEPQVAAQPGATDAPAPTTAEPGGQEALLKDPATPIVPPEAVHEQPAPFQAPRPAGYVAPPVYPAPQGFGPAAPDPLPVADLPAGLDPDELAAAPLTSARRSRLRRRVAFLRAAREVLLRDLGGFVYELHRTAGDLEHDAHRRLRETKLSRLSRVDAELHELELRLDDVRRQVIVREPGVGGECPNCGELFGSDANYCGHCGVPLTDAARRAVPREAAQAAAAEPPPAPVQPTDEIAAAEPAFAWPR